MQPQDLIRVKRDGGVLSRAHIEAFVSGISAQDTLTRWSEGQVAAMAMAILLRGMDRAETVALTQAMTHSGEVLDWRGAGFHGPVIDKHSTGGVGDKVSLILAPVLAACGGVVPMVSGRGLAHTGGTLDKLEAFPGYQVDLPEGTLRQILHEAGCAIVGASHRVAPADRRLYAIRDVTATVESVPLVTASILSKKLAAGLQALVMDVKVGNGSFTPTVDAARTLARSLVEVAAGAGLPTRALLTDMNQVLGATAGNALEVQECLDIMAGPQVPPPAPAPGAGSAGSPARRLRDLTLSLAAELLHLSGLAASRDEGWQRAAAALDSGAAAERFARMVSLQGGPKDVFHEAGLIAAPEVGSVLAQRDGFVVAHDTRALGMAVVTLGGGRRVPTDAVDPRVGLSRIAGLGQAVRRDDVLAQVHAATPSALEAALAEVRAALTVGEEAPPVAPLVIETVV